MYELAHVGIVVRDADRSKEFYKKYMGCTEIAQHEDERLKLVFLQAGKSVIELLQYPGEYAERQNGVVDHIAFYVDDMELALGKLEEANVKFLFDQPLVVGSKKIMFFLGPDGERIEFVQLLK